MALFLLNGELSPILGAESGAPVPAAAAEAGTAVAPAGAAPGTAEVPGFNMWWMYGVWILVIVGFYFLTIRPQRKREKQMKEMQSGIGVGDNILTSGGLFGRVAEVGHDCFVVEFGTNRGVRVPIRKSDVLGVKTPQITAPPETKE